MSGEKNPDMAGCNASIMKNVWEIRAREYRQKIQMEQERMEKSALPSINQDWASRLVGKQGKYKRVEKKTELDISQKDNNIWKSKHTQVPPRTAGSSLLSKPLVKNRSSPAQASNLKEKREPKKNRLQLLTFITQSQPSAMVWGKSWKCNKNLPPAEGATVRSDWGQCWMFATQQPHAEEGKPWPNGPNIRSPQNLDLWKKPDQRVMDSREVELGLPTEEWQMSWRKSDNNNKQDSSSVNGENVFKSVFSPLLGETQHNDKTLCSSEWSESWQSIKPSSKQEYINPPNDGLMNELVAKKQDKDQGVSCRWEECWRLANHHGCHISQLPQVKQSHSLEWANAWKSAVLSFNNPNNLALSFREDQALNYDCSLVKEPHLQTIMFMRCNQKCRNPQPCNDTEVLHEWNNSWLMVKNNPTPPRETEDVSNTSPTEMETLNEEEMKNQRYLTSAGKKVMQNTINISFANTAALRLWQNSHKFVNGANAQINVCKAPTDPRVIIPKEAKASNSRKHLYTFTVEKLTHGKWVGCHLLCKSQPRSNKRSASVQKLMLMGDEFKDKVLEEWAESWRFFVEPGRLQKIISVKSLLGWNESWKLLLPPHQPGNGPKSK